MGAGGEQRVEGDSVGLAVVAVHFVQQLQRQLPPASLLTGADKAAVGDHIALAATPHHVLENPQRLLYLRMPQPAKHIVSRLPFRYSPIV